MEEETHKRQQEVDEKQRAADRLARDGGRAKRELERLKKAVESGFEDLQRQASCEKFSYASGLLSDARFLQFWHLPSSSGKKLGEREGGCELFAEGCQVCRSREGGGGK